MTTVVFERKTFSDETIILDPNKNYIFRWCVLRNIILSVLDRNPDRTILFENCTIANTEPDRNLIYSQSPLFIEENEEEEIQKLYKDISKSKFKEWSRKQST